VLDEARPFVSLLAAQAALDDWVRDYNATRPHQSLELRAPVTPAERFQAAPEEQRELLPLWLPAQLAAVPARAANDSIERLEPRRRRRPALSLYTAKCGRAQRPPLRRFTTRMRESDGRSATGGSANAADELHGRLLDAAASLGLDQGAH
jgi:Integrase core domain